MVFHRSWGWPKTHAVGIWGSARAARTPEREWSTNGNTELRLGSVPASNATPLLLNLTAQNGFGSTAGGSEKQEQESA